MLTKEHADPWQQIDMCERERAAACFLHTLPGVGKKTLQKLQQGLGSLWRVFQVSPETLQEIVSNSKVRQTLKEIHQEEQKAWNYYRKLKKQGIGVVLAGEKHYPEMLLQIFDPPFLLYWKGDFSLALQPALAMVGCRQSTAYGREQAQQFASGLARSGLVIVSGLARGIDTAAHQGALQVPYGKTIAVLGSGISVIYPPENKDLAEQIVQRGLLLSEFVPSAPPNPGNFPQRNRIISGLSRGVLVVEARKKSGALITADFAMEQGREVYALPGLLTNPCSEGPHRLIQQGAKLVMGTDDILEDYVGIIQQELKEIPSSVPEKAETEIVGKQPDLMISAEEKKILDVLRNEPKSMDEILSCVSMNPGELMKWLLQLEIQGRILSLPGNSYQKKE